MKRLTFYDTVTCLNDGDEALRLFLRACEEGEVASIKFFPGESDRSPMRWEVCIRGMTPDPWTSPAA